MSNISQDKLLELVDTRYSLVSLAAKRAKQIREGAPKLINTDSTNPLTIAMEEIQSGKIAYNVPDNDEPITAATEDVELLGLPAVPEAEEALPKPEDILPVPEEMIVEAEAPAEAEAEAPEVPEMSAEPASEETAEDAGEITPAETDTPESTSTEQAAQPED